MTRAVGRLVAGLLVGVMVLVTLVGIGMAVLAKEYGVRVLSVQSGSMVPVFSKGDAVVARQVPLGVLRPGEVISYKSPNDPSVTISHRLITIDTKSGLLTTKGDSLPTSDPPIPASAVIGRVGYVVPGFGYILDWLHTPLGLLAVLYLPAVGMIVMEVRRLSRSWQSNVYRLGRVLR
jgi:signal peptidase I